MSISAISEKQCESWADFLDIFPSLDLLTAQPGQAYLLTIHQSGHESITFADNKPGLA